MTGFGEAYKRSGVQARIEGTGSCQSNLPMQYSPLFHHGLEVPFRETSATNSFSWLSDANHHAVYLPIEAAMMHCPVE